MFKKISLYISIFSATLLFGATKVLAGFQDLETSNPLSQGYFKSVNDQASSCGDNCQFSTVFSNIYTNLTSTTYKIIMGLAVLYLLYSGFQYLTSGGSPEKVKKARSAMINSILGIVLMVSMFTILAIIWAIVAQISNNV